MARVLAGTSPERTNRVMLAAAIVFAGLAAALVFVSLRDGGGSDSSGPAATPNAVVANQAIPANTKLTADMLELRALPDGALVDGAYADMSAVVGLATRYPIAAGEQLTQQKLGATLIDDEHDVSLVVDPGKRAFAVEVDEVTSVGGLLLPGYFVDVIAVFPEEFGLSSSSDTAAASDLGAITLLQNIQVLSVAQEAQEPVPPAADVADADGTGPAADTGPRGQRADDAERQPDARSVTIAVSPQDAQLLALVQERGGTIWLSLRGAGDHQELPIDPVALQRALAAAGADILP